MLTGLTLYGRSRPVKRSYPGPAHRMMQIAVTHACKLTNQPSNLALSYPLIPLDLSYVKLRQQGTARSLYPYNSNTVPLIQDDALVTKESSETKQELERLVRSKYFSLRIDDDARADGPKVTIRA